MKHETRNLKLKYEIETWNWNLISKLDIETWNWNLKLKLDIETWYWNLKSKLEIVTLNRKLKFLSFWYMIVLIKLFQFLLSSYFVRIPFTLHRVESFILFIICNPVHLCRARTPRIDVWYALTQGWVIFCLHYCNWQLLFALLQLTITITITIDNFCKHHQCLYA